MNKEIFFQVNLEDRNGDEDMFVSARQEQSIISGRDLDLLSYKERTKVSMNKKKNQGVIRLEEFKVNLT